MRKLVLLLACLGCPGHGQRVEISIRQSQGPGREVEAARALAAFLLAFNAVGNTWNRANPRSAHLAPLKRCSHLVAMSDEVSRRAILSGAAAALFNAGAAYAAKKDYITMDAYNARFRNDLKDKETFKYFQFCAEVATQTTKFADIAAKNVKDVTAEAIRWDKDYRMENLDKAVGALEGEAKEKGENISKKILAKLKKLDELSKDKKPDEIAVVGKEVADLFSDVVDLAPKKLERFGELKSTLGDL